MTEKKKFRKIKETLNNFHEWEMRNAALLLEKQKTGDVVLPETTEEVVYQFINKDCVQKIGLLSTAYLCYLDYEKDTSKEERKTIKEIVRKYGLYAHAIAQLEPIATSEASEEDCINREGIRVLMQLNKNGINRYSDLYNSRMLLEDHGNDILYCATWKKWLLWDGRCWVDEQVKSIYQLAIKSIREMHSKALKFKNMEDRLILMEHAGRSESVQRIEAMVRATTWNKTIRIQPEDLDKNNMIFNCANGSIDLKSGRLREHQRCDRITKLSPVEYDEKAECPQWKNFLKSIFNKNKDLILYVQKILGMCLSGDVSAQAMFILYGTGANGKSTFLNTIMKIMGDYSVTTPTETFLHKRKDSANNDIARLKGTRFVSAMEGDYGEKLAEAVVKRLTGNDRISARFLYGEYFDFIPTFKIFMATNHKPKINGMDNAIWRRIKLIPFEISYNGRQQDSKLSKKLEAELPGILAWMVEGCLRWQKEGVGDPPDITAATREYRYEMSSIETFLREECRRDDNEMTKASLLFDAYKEWAEDNNDHIMSLRSFGMRLAETGMEKTRLSSGYHWMGIALNQKSMNETS